MPTEDILIKVSPQETQIAVVSQGSLQEIYIERNLSQGLVGNIFIGKVSRVLPGMQSAFIDIGLEKTGFLHVGDVYQSMNGNNHLPIEKVLYAGQYILVQVLKDPMGNKGARLSTYISIVGRNLVYLPTEKNSIGISQKIIDNTEREGLRTKLESILPKNIDGTFILRTAAFNAVEEDFSQDIFYLTQIWENIASIHKTSVKLIYQELPIAFKVCRDTKNIDSIKIDNSQYFAKLKEFLAKYIPHMQNKLYLYTEARDIFSLYNVDSEIEKSLHRRVELKSGGFLIIDQTEAMVTIDVNTGAYIGKTSFADTVLKINIEAAHAIARQLRLRNLGGIVIIDFIDMNNEEHQQIVLSNLNQALRYDRAKNNVYGFTSLGLVEMTRKRTRDSVAKTLCEPCKLCLGTGLAKTTQTICYDIMHEILRQSQQFQPKAFKIVAHPSLIERFLQEEKTYLEELKQIINKDISLHSQNFAGIDMYDIILIN